MDDRGREDDVESFEMRSEEGKRYAVDGMFGDKGVWRISPCQGERVLVTRISTLRRDEKADLTADPNFA